MDFDADLLKDLVHHIERNESSQLQEKLVFITLKHPQILNTVIPKYGMSLFHYSVGFSDNDTRTVKVLMDHGADPNNTECSDKVSPLHLSIIYEFDSVLDFLLKHGGDPFIQDGEGKTCYDLVENLEQPDIFRSILVKHTSFSGLSSISSEGSSASDTLSYMTCMTSNDEPIQAGAKMTTFFTDDDTEPESLFEHTGVSSAEENEPRTKRRYGFLSTIREETSSVMSAWNKVSHLSHASNSNSNFGNKTANSTNTTIQSDDPRNSAETAFLHHTETEETLEETRGMVDLKTRLENSEASSMVSITSTLSTHSVSVASTPSDPPSPTHSEMDRLERQIQNMNMNLPVTPTTYHTISKFLSPCNQLTLTRSEKLYSPDLLAAIQDLTIIERLKYGDLKIEVAQDAGNDSPKRNGKAYYNYVLLDPKIIKRINFSGDHLKSDVIKNSEKFRKFISAIFYIGKGCGKRPIKHLEDAKIVFQRKSNQSSSNDKIKRILDIWKSGQGVIVHSFFHHSPEREANVNEAAMIDAMGLKELSNLKKGSYSGEVVSKWNQKQKNQFGVFLLRTCFSLYAVSGGTVKEIFPHDV